MTRFLMAFALIAALVLTALGFRGCLSEKPPLEVFPDMDRQAKHHPQDRTAYYGDERTDRLPPAGAVPYLTERQKEYPFQQPIDMYRENEYLATGKMGDVFGAGFPIEIDNETLRHGRERFELFCAPCHGAYGDGKGVTTAERYNMIGVASFHDQRLIDMPEGQYFDTITNGKNTMGPYGSKTTPEERWAIIAYIRALQKAGAARLEDAPPEERKELEQ